MNTYATTNSATHPPSTSDSAGWASASRKRDTSRLRGRRRSLPYLLLGVLLVCLCAGTFLWISLGTNDRQPVLALAQPVAVGHVLTAQDLRQVNVAADPEVRVVHAGQAADLIGKTIAMSLAAGALLTPDSVGTAAVPVAGQAIASLALKAGQFPAEVTTGARVSVVYVPATAAGPVVPTPASEAGAAWPGVVTTSSTDQVTVVSVQLAEAAARQVAAVPVGQLSLVLLAGGGR
jgi:hypothetical protein